MGRSTSGLIQARSCREKAVIRLSAVVGSRRSGRRCGIDRPGARFAPRYMLYRLMH